MVRYAVVAVQPIANCSKIKENNLPFYVCPGTSSWTSFSGRTTNSIRNIYLAVAAGMRHGAKGFMITDWGDSGHLQPPCISYLPFVVGAGTSWGTEDGLQEANVEGLQSLKRRNGLSAIFAKIMSAWEASLLFRIFAVSVAIVPGSLVFGTFFCVLPLLLIPFEYFCCFIDSDSYHRYIASQEDLERRVSNVDVNSLFRLNRVKMSTLSTKFQDSFPIIFPNFASASWFLNPSRAFSVGFAYWTSRIFVGSPGGPSSNRLPRGRYIPHSCLSSLSVLVFVPPRVMG